MSHPHQSRLVDLAREHGGAVSIELDGALELLVFDCPPGKPWMGCNAQACNLADRVYDTAALNGARICRKDRTGVLVKSDGGWEPRVVRWETLTHLELIEALTTAPQFVAYAWQDLPDGGAVRQQVTNGPQPMPPAGLIDIDVASSGRIGGWIGGQGGRFHWFDSLDEAKAAVDADLRAAGYVLTHVPPP